MTSSASFDPHSEALAALVGGMNRGRRRAFDPDEGSMEAADRAWSDDDDDSDGSDQPAPGGGPDGAS